MAVAVDVLGTVDGTRNSTAVTSFNYTGITVGSGSNRALIFTAAINYNPPQATAVTAVWDSGASNQSMTLLATGAEPVNGDQVFVFGLRNPVSGNKTLRISWTTGCSIVCNAISFTGVNQTSDAAAFPASTTPSSPNNGSLPSATLTTQSGDYTVGVFTCSYPLFPTGTKIFDSVSDGGGTLYLNDWNGFAQYLQASTTSTTLTYTTWNTQSEWGGAAVNVRAPGSSTYTLTAATGAIALSGQAAALVYVPLQSATAPLMTGRSRLLRRPWLRAMTSMPTPSAIPVIPPNAVFVPAHSLLTNMLACYLPGMYGGVPVSATGPTLADGAGGAGTAVTTVEGPASRSNTLTAAKGLIATAPSGFKTWTNFTIYWRGLVIGTGDNFCPIVGVSATNVDNPPYYMLGISANSGSYAQTLAFYGDGATFTTTGSFDATGLYGQIVDFAATATVGGNVTFYVNGVQIATNALVTISTSDATAKITVNQGIDATSRSPNASVNMACFWDRALSAGEILGLHSAPYAFLQTGVGYTLTAATGAFALTGNPAALQCARNLPATTGAFTLTGNTAGLRLGRNLPAATGAFTLTGNAAILQRTRNLPATTGTFTLTGLTTPLGVGLPVSTGVFTLTGNAAVLKATRVTTAAAGAFTLNGRSAGLIYSASGARTLIANAGVFTVSGQAATLKFSRAAVSATGVFTLNGRAATLAYTRIMPAVKGTFTLTGQAAVLSYSRVMPETKGTFTLNGQPATLAYSRALPLAKGAFNLNGPAVNLIYSGAGSKTMPTSPGSFVLTGNAAATLAVRKMPTTKGTFLLTGQPAALLNAHGLTAATGSFILTGRAAVLTWAHGHDTVMPASKGTFIMSGNNVGLIWSTKPELPGVLHFGRRVTINRW